jgi:hypothetical protein
LPFIFYPKLKTDFFISPGIAVATYFSFFAKKHSLSFAKINLNIIFGDKFCNIAFNIVFFIALHAE